MPICHKYTYTLRKHNKNCGAYRLHFNSACKKMREYENTDCPATKKDAAGSRTVRRLDHTDPIILYRSLLKSSLYKIRRTRGLGWICLLYCLK